MINMNTNLLCAIANFKKKYNKYRDQRWRKSQEKKMVNWIKQRAWESAWRDGVTVVSIRFENSPYYLPANQREAFLEKYFPERWGKKTYTMSAENQGTWEYSVYYIYFQKEEKI